MPPIIDPQKCIGCGTCVDICNSDIFTFSRASQKVPTVAYPDECWHCDSCVMDCPKGAIRLRVPLAFMFLHVDADTLHKKEC